MDSDVIEQAAKRAEEAGAELVTALGAGYDQNVAGGIRALGYAAGVLRGMHRLGDAERDAVYDAAWSKGYEAGKDAALPKGDVLPELAESAAGKRRAELAERLGGLAHMEGWPSLLDRVSEYVVRLEASQERQRADRGDLAGVLGVETDAWDGSWSYLLDRVRELANGETPSARATAQRMTTHLSEAVGKTGSWLWLLDRVRALAERGDVGEHLSHENELRKALRLSGTAVPWAELLTRVEAMTRRYIGEAPPAPLGVLHVQPRGEHASRDDDGTRPLRHVEPWTAPTGGQLTVPVDEPDAPRVIPGLAPAPEGES